MNIIKKITSISLICVLLISACIYSASALTISDGKFSYELNPSTKEATIIKYTGSDADVKIPSVFSGFTVTKIASTAFKNTLISSVLLPNTITEIGNSAFEGCSSLTSFILPSSVTSLGTDLFRDCTSLEKFYFNPYISTLPNNMFVGCTSLSNVKLNPAVMYIGSGAFYGCTSLTDTSFLSSVVSFGDYTFSNCGLTSVTISQFVTSIPRLSFANNKSLTTVEIPKNVTFIHNEAFLGCDNMIINCYKNTTAHIFALDNNIPFVILDPYPLGDVDMNDFIDIKDATLIQKHLADIVTLDETQISLADFNGDGQVNIMDATAIQKYLVS